MAQQRAAEPDADVEAALMAGDGVRGVGVLVEVAEMAEDHALAVVVAEPPGGFRHAAGGSALVSPIARPASRT
ncbi:hypothetical protein [Streptomyces tirandamycinicus]|uniref:hypothetical protein n=1 Tax=Streptomyces tirandamycinicus TaxID=2174846 RepID=UPI00142E209E|nr:hypothetical protein [Streptomyces tirandamycinicus]